ncbi:acyl-CoA dehydrogenase family protein [Nocardia alba]|uniref:Dibenzothiophene monooxygenase n=1 Tax=Nocardia alba TaxID=225051 RepID=A0A4V2PB10_9NOCA|nr:acyl-CoA dehydrogenase family protein [Nocardia alba]TCJ95625.1 alkylation response protein AidB-like acyl-CoA dehydrogenase [Nocardia alba]
MTTTAAPGPASLDSPRLREAIEAIAQDARRRLDAPTERPDLALRLIRELRLGAVRVPAADGGGGYSTRELFELLIRLGEADPDVPHILRIHYGFVEELRRDPAEYRDRPWREEVVAGKLFGGASSELENRVGVYNFDTTLLPDGENFRLNGRKFYSTGSLYSDYLRITANDEGGGQISALIPADRAGVVHADDWDGLGQRHTATGTTILDNVLVEPSELLPFRPVGSDRRPGGAQPQLLLHAIAAGILRAVTADAAALLRDRPRSYTWGNADESREDPQLLQIVGELSSAAFLVEAAVLAAADTLGRAVDHAHAHGRVDNDLERAASLAAARVKVGVEEIALRAAGELYGVGGASAIRRSTHLDRHWRNLRTLFSHNPTAFKARAIGDAVVNDAPLPTVGFF